jgi:predicted MPP superfamily phosphohydrolase
MSPAAWLLILIAAAVGHFGLHIALYNRINGFGWPRKVVKTIVKFFLATTILIPVAVTYFYWPILRDMLSGSPDIHLPTPLWLYGTVCLATWIVLGVPWLIWRPLFQLEWVAAPRKIEVVDVQQVVRTPLALTPKARLQARIPLNQLLELSIEQIALPVAGLPPMLDGYRIAQVSDVHLTGEIHPDYAKYVLERATAWQPDLFALTGDIIDKQPCIDWLPEIFSPAAARDGCYFVLGNHDTRVKESWLIRDAMSRAGWTDLGSRYLERELSGVQAMVIGNEHPWFERPEIDRTGDHFRLLLSHSPDQFSWARRNGVHVMLAGHTHGGQGRLPLAGPLLSPSFHGSRYASGEFYKAPTTLHVTRGIGGVHLMRINCRPQLSLLTLRAV